MSNQEYVEGLLERLTQFIYLSAKDMNLPGSFMEYYAGLVKEQVMGFIDERETFEPAVLQQCIEGYGRAVNAARKQTKEQLFTDLEGHATIAASAFMAREYAILVDPGVIPIFQPKQENQ